MKHIKRAISFLTVICCLAVGIVPLYAAASNESGGEIPRIVFTNEPVGSPDLYVTKTVESAVDGLEVPEAAKEKEFTFTLRLNGELAKNVPYHKYIKDAEGQETEIYDGSGVFGNKAFTTDESGRFYLKHGQKVWFKGEEIRALTPTAQYEVTEETEEGYQQTEPSLGGPAKGLVTEYGATAAFVNQYVPKGTGTEAKLEVRKSFSYPEGYMPPEVPEFTFSLKLNNVPWANKTYEILPINGGTEGAQEGKTDEQGRFSLKGGYKAVFTGDDTDRLTTGMDYEVEELDLPEGWRATGEISQKGSTHANTILYFNNSSASFTVTKQLTKDSVQPEDGSTPEFTFELTKSDRSLWQGAQYYLYDIESRELITQEKADNEEGAGDYRETDEKGRFTLQPGQAAVFFGIPSGTKYNVQEIAENAGEESGGILYTQILPADLKGYVDQTVTTGDTVLSFENKGQKTKKTLNVTKTVENDKGEASSAQDQDEFYFILEERSNEGFQAVAGAVYEVTGGISRSTDEKGRFYIKANETAQFKLLKHNVYYQVTEEQSSLSTEYEAKTTEPQGGMLTLDGTLHFRFVNKYKPDKLDLELTKVNNENNKLAGAGFMLYWDSACTDPVFPANEEPNGESEEKYETDQEGVLKFEDLKAGTYYLKEEKAPSGYMVLERPIEIKVVRDENGLAVSVDGMEYKKPESGTAMETDSDVVTKIDVSLKTESDPQSRDTVGITVCNSQYYELPSTGGPGIFGYTIGGILMMIAALILYRNKYAGRC